MKFSSKNSNGKPYYTAKKYNHNIAIWSIAEGEYMYRITDLN